MKHLAVLLSAWNLLVQILHEVVGVRERSVEVRGGMAPLEGGHDDLIFVNYLLGDICEQSLHY